MKQQKFSQAARQQGASVGLQALGMAQKIELNRHQRDRVQNCLDQFAQQDKEAQYKSARLRNQHKQKVNDALKH